MKKLNLFFVGLTFSCYLTAQCDPPQAIVTLSGNQLTAPVTTGGDLFWDGEKNHLSVPLVEGNPATIFLEELWLSAKSSDGQLKLSATTYGRDQSENEYAPGPLPPGGANNTPESCARWDRLWSIRRYQIESHRAD